MLRNRLHRLTRHGCSSCVTRHIGAWSLWAFLPVPTTSGVPGPGLRSVDLARRPRHRSGSGRGIANCRQHRDS
jgi:hypothetical protein